VEAVEHVLHAFAAVNVVHGKTMRVAAGLRYCDLGALAAQIAVTRNQYADIVIGYMVSKGAASGDASVEVLMSVQAAWITYEYGYEEALRMLLSDEKTAFCAQMVENANAILEGKTVKPTGPE